MDGRELVDDVLFVNAGRKFLRLGRPVDVNTVRREVASVESELRAHGVRAGSVLAVRLPPSLASVCTLLAGWHAGAQVMLLDHRLTDHEVTRALERIRPRALVSAASGFGGPLLGHHPVRTTIDTYPGRPAESEHVLIQLSSGSTGPSKIIGRTAAGLAAELERYARIPGMPGRGERIVVLSSLIHTYGLIGGLLYGMHSGADVVVPDQLTTNGILDAITSGPEPTTVLGVPVQLELLAATGVNGRPPAQLVGAVSAGEVIRPEVPTAFAERYGVPVGECYGMTEVGLIAMDMAGTHRPAVGPPAPGVEVRLDGDELLVACAENPYLGTVDESRWVDGWLHTRDAAAIDASGVVRVLGRLDSQVNVGGTRVDLSEVEQTLAELPEVIETVVVFDRKIEAYIALRDPARLADVEAELANRLAPFKRPRLNLVARLPRTSSGKRRRDLPALRACRTDPATSRTAS
ncbi:class I adenylate-forming enzyme family protein [Actinophytocola sp.]|uniref:class I adenylate-forming enzyme family protein n=1 Tax=Actinophytocola sp. TaxID=1872138 RepID=UPI003D6C20C6